MAIEHEIFVKKGELLGCRNGHPVFKATRDLYYDDPCMAADVDRVDARIAEPVDCEPFPDCPECGIALLGDGAVMKRITSH